MFDAVGAEILARLQFAFTVSFHIFFPAFTIGLASYLAVLNMLWLWSGESAYRVLFDYWLKIFAIAFGMGVVSGVVMSYQFGTNWSVFSDRTGPVLGPLMAYEVLSAFFLEAGFLGIMLFGRERVGNGLHMFATAMVAFGTLLSAFWILSANSWMHTPAGFGTNADGQFVPENWVELIFNPSFPYRLAHMTLAAYLTTAFAVGGVAAWHLLKGQQDRATRIMFSMAMWMAALVTPIQIFVGDLHGLNTLEYQPAKVMAMEGHFDSYANGAPFFLIGIPNQAEKRVDYAVEVPKLSSLILKHDLHAPMSGLDTIADDEEPPVAIVFLTFRLMIALGLLMLGVGLWSLWHRWRGTLYSASSLHRAAVAMAPSGFIAVLAGWITTEVGRQPYTVYNLLRTADSLSPVDAPAVGASLVSFVVVYCVVFGSGTFYILRLMRASPMSQIDALEEGPVRAAGTTPAAQVDAAEAGPGKQEP
jgi:cytochrome bd ubiquinol oxidase subunit I